MTKKKDNNRDDKGKFVKGNQASKKAMINKKNAEKWTEIEAMRFISELETWLLSEDENIFYEDFIYLQTHNYKAKIRGNTVSYLTNKYPSFCEQMEKIKNIQKIKLKKFGTLDKLNTSITKFILNVEHGMVEKKEIKNEINQNIIQDTPTMIVFSKEKKD